MTKRNRLKPYDSAAIRRLGAEIDALKAADRWTEAEFRRILPLWDEACGDRPEALEALIFEADEAWLDGIITTS
jgi:hypothetical protein